MHKFLCNRQHIPKHVQDYLPTHSSKCTVNFHKSPLAFPQLFFSWLVKVREDFFFPFNISVFDITPRQGAAYILGEFMEYAIKYKNDIKEKKK